MGSQHLEQVTCFLLSFPKCLVLPCFFCLFVFCLFVCLFSFLEAAAVAIVIAKELREGSQLKVISPGETGRKSLEQPKVLENEKETQKEEK